MTQNYNLYHLWVFCYVQRSNLFVEKYAFFCAMQYDYDIRNHEAMALSSSKVLFIMPISSTE